MDATIDVDDVKTMALELWTARRDLGRALAANQRLGAEVETMSTELAEIRAALPNPPATEPTSDLPASLQRRVDVRMAASPAAPGRPARLAAAAAE